MGPTFRPFCIFGAFPIDSDRKQQTRDQRHLEQDKATFHGAVEMGYVDGAELETQKQITEDVPWRGQEMGSYRERRRDRSHLRPPLGPHHVQEEQPAKHELLTERGDDQREAHRRQTEDYIWERNLHVFHKSIFSLLSENN